MPFLLTDDGLVNMAHVVEARRRSKGDYILKGADEADLGVVNARQIEEHIEQICPAIEPYDCLQVWFNGEEPYSTVSNVVAWGISFLGFVYPITDDEASAKIENYALRRRGQERIEVPDQGSFENEVTWLAAMATQRKQEEARKAAKK